MGLQMDKFCQFLIVICPPYTHTFLGTTLSRVVHIDEVNTRIAKASAAFGRLCGSIWDRSGIRLDTKLKVYRSVVLPTLLYACETWTVYQWHAKRLNLFHTSCLRKLLKIKWRNLDSLPMACQKTEPLPYKLS